MTVWVQVGRFGVYNTADILDLLHSADETKQASKQPLLFFLLFQIQPSNIFLPLQKTTKQNKKQNLPSQPAPHLLS